MPPATRLDPDLEGLLDRVRPRALGVLGHFRIPEQDAEDLLQESFLVLLHKRAGVEDPERWFLGTLRNHCRRYWQARRRSLYTAVDGAVLEALSAPVKPEQHRSDLRRDLSAALGGVPPRCRPLLRLRFELGYGPVEAARRLGYRTSSAYKVLQRCVASLTTRLSSCGIEPRPTDA